MPLELRDWVIVDLGILGVLAFWQGQDGTLLWNLLGILLIGTVIVVISMTLTPDERTNTFPAPRLWTVLSTDARASGFWLAVRCYVGVAFLTAGWHKITSGWLDGSGTSLSGFWKGAVAIPQSGTPKIAADYDWFRDILSTMLNNNMGPWFSWFIAFGEFLIGVGLILGLLTGFAALFACLLNMSFLLAGSGSTNPILLIMSIGILFASSVAGWIGLDRWVRPAISGWWNRTFHRNTSTA